MRTSSLSVVAVMMYTVLLLKETEGLSSYSLSSMVIPFEARREGLAQQDPCLGDDILFVCTRNESSSSAVARFFSNGNTVYTFVIPNDIDSPEAIQDSQPGLVGVLLNETTITLLVNLTTSVDVVNGTELGCGENSDTATRQTLSVIGTASAPSVSVRSVGLTALIVDMSVPDTGAVCVDTYNAAIVTSQMTDSTVVAVTNPTQRMYSFEFSVNLCRDTLTNATAFAMTDNMKGVMATPATIITNSVDKSTIITSTVSASQTFTSSGIAITLTWQVIDVDIVNGFNVTCRLMETSEFVNCQTIGISTVTQQKVSLSYNNDLAGKDVTFMITYMDGTCADSETTALTVLNVNSSSPQEVRDLRAVMVNFNETLFDASSVSVMFSSNCTAPITVDYNRSPIMITIPETIVNSGRCRYTIKLVSSESQQIGYPVVGFFQIDGLPQAPVPFPIAAVVGGICAGLLLLIVVVSLGIIGGCICYRKYKRKDSNQLADEDNLELEHTDRTNSATIEHEKAPDGEEYAVVVQKTSKPPNPTGSLYQNPDDIQHEEAPMTGDLYAVTEKKPKKGSKKELDAMYSIPDKTKKNQSQQLTYAAIDVVAPSGGGGGKPTPQTEYATVVN